MADTTELPKLSDEDFTLFKSRWQLATKAEEQQRVKEIEDLQFEAGQHWSDEDATERDRTGRPALTIDLLSGPIKQVTNQQRTSRPGIVISPVGDGADEDKAEAWQGIIRRIERLSGAHRAYTWAGQHQVKMGRGFWVVRNVEVGKLGEQDIRIEEVDNQHTIYIDPTYKKLNGEDKKWAIRFEDITHEEYAARFGDSRLADVDAKSWQGVGDAPPEWITPSGKRIAEYYYLTETTTKVRILSDGSQLEDEAADVPEGLTVARTVKRTKKQVNWCLLNGAGEKLDEATIPGEYIPVVMVFGERRNINGLVDYRGLVRMAKDPSRMEDWCETALMESISQAKTAPWLAEWSQIAEFADIWKHANTKPPAVLPYKKVSGDNGAPLPPPQRVPAGVDVSALTMAAQRMQNHVRNVTGMADLFQEETAAQQANSSGRAIIARRQAQELSTSDYLENLGDGIVLTAKIILSMAREVYDTPRVLRILGDDEKQKDILVQPGMGEMHPQMAQRMAAEQKVKALFDPTVGEYDISVTAGKRYATARQESVQTISDLIPVLPPPMQVEAVKILVKNLDGPGMQELASALEPNDQNGQIPPQVAMQMQQMQQQMQQMQQFIQTEQAKHQAALQAESLKQQTALQLRQMEIESKERLAMLQAQMEAARAGHEHQHAMEKQNDQQAHDAALAASEAGQAEILAYRQALQQAEQAQQAGEGEPLL